MRCDGMRCDAMRCNPRRRNGTNLSLFSAFSFVTLSSSQASNSLLNYSWDLNPPWAKRWTLSVLKVLNSKLSVIWMCPNARSCLFSFDVFFLYVLREYFTGTAERLTEIFSRHTAWRGMRRGVTRWVKAQQKKRRYGRESNEKKKRPFEIWLQSSFQINIMKAFAKWIVWKSIPPAAAALRI